MTGTQKMKIVCFSCKKPIHGARTVINEQWHCATCTYRIEFPDKELPKPKSRRVGPKEPGNQALFDREQYARRRDG